MALKADRHEARTDISFFMNGTGNRGIIVVHDTSASGAGMDASAALVKIPTAGVSGTYPAGLLLCDVVNYDLTRQHINWHKDEVQIGGKVTLLKDGWVVTNAVSGSPTAGQTAYYDLNGHLTPTELGGAVKVGRFLTSKDADGYAKVDINITG